MPIAPRILVDEWYTIYLFIIMVLMLYGFVFGITGKWGILITG